MKDSTEVVNSVKHSIFCLNLKNRVILAGIYLSVLLIPSVLFSAKGFVRALYPVLVLLALLGGWRLFLFITLPVFLFVPGAIFFATNFRAPLNETFWVVLMGTNLIEASDYLTSNALIPILGGVLALLLWIYCFFQMRGAIFKNKGWRIFCALLIIVPVVHIVKRWDDPVAEMNHHFSESYPWNMFLSYRSAMADLNMYTSLQKIADEDSIQILNPGLPQQTLVLVIGESARRDRLQLYGAATANNPGLSGLSGELTVFSNVITLHPHTAASIPVILTKQKGFHRDSNMASFIQIFKKAGYKVYWISNQASLGGSGSNRIGYYARTADESKFFHIHNSNNPTVHDGEVLNDFLQKLPENAPKKLFVLHLQGSHYGFEKRYPYEYAKFDDPYDNTLLYTDHILTEVVAALKADGKPNAMLYLADHGLLLKQCGKKFTHFDNKESYEIPFLIWSSGSLREKVPLLFRQADVNKDAPMTTEFLFESLIDLAGIVHSGRDDSLSVFSRTPAIGPRLVKTYSKIVDYDLASNDEDCHLDERVDAQARGR